MLLPKLPGATARSTRAPGSPSASASRTEAAYRLAEDATERTPGSQPPLERVPPAERQGSGQQERLGPFGRHASGGPRVGLRFQSAPAGTPDPVAGHRQAPSGEEDSRQSL